jgi:hypothetical protein
MRDYLLWFLAWLLVAIWLWLAYHNFWYDKVYNTWYDMWWRYRWKSIQRILKDCISEEDDIVKCLYIAEIWE